MWCAGGVVSGASNRSSSSPRHASPRTPGRPCCACPRTPARASACATLRALLAQPILEQVSSTLSQRVEACVSFRPMTPAVFGAADAAPDATRRREPTRTNGVLCSRTTTSSAHLREATKEHDMARHGIQEHKSREVRPGRLAEKRRHIRHAARGATTHDSLLIHPTHCTYGNLCTSPRFPPLRA